jgi:hypothetical protein
MRRLPVAAGLVAAMLAVPATPAYPAPVRPLLAYYYQWFDPDSWNRAKIDYPRLGRYSSDDPGVMRQHVEWAKSAGIDGFIVSWKSTPTNDRRLRLLMDVSRQQDFKLAVIYQGLDFGRNPLPASRVGADFRTFRDQFAGDPVFFRLGGKPLTVFSGTWKFSRDQVAGITGPVRDKLLVLSTEKSVDGYRRLAGVTDGDAYYWSSVNPETNKGYAPKLDDMSRAIHQDHKYWMAPVAPGFDARLVGGARTVDRKDGRTLRTEYAASDGSSPDVLGLISWNEFSENTYVEPSQRFGTRYLDVLRELRQPAASAGPSPSSAGPSPSSPSPSAAGAHTAAPAVSRTGNATNVALLGGFLAVLVGTVALFTFLRRRRSRAP